MIRWSNEDESPRGLGLCEYCGCCDSRRSVAGLRLDENCTSRMPGGCQLLRNDEAKRITCQNDGSTEDVRLYPLGRCLKKALFTDDWAKLFGIRLA